MKKFLVVFVMLLMVTSHVFAQNYKTHKVTQNEKIEDIAKVYMVTVNDIYALNPDAKNGLRPNMVLIIPKTQVQAELSTVKEITSYKQIRIKRKETLYSIAKEYKVTEDEIKKANTFLYSEPLRKGTKVRIPIFTTKQVLEEVATVVDLTKPYVVLPKEGKWRVAYKFGITIEDLEALNPDMAEVLKVGDTIRVPNIPDTNEKVVEEKYDYYEVQPKEGFYRLKVKLGLEKSELEALNPQLVGSELKVGMVLKVPKKVDDDVTGMISDNTLVASDLEKRKFNSGTKHIAVLLPFNLNKVSFDSIQGTMNQIRKDSYLNFSLEFQSGVLIALDSLKKLGVSAKVDVYDTENKTSTISNLIRDHNFEELDAIIGPLTQSSVEYAADKLSIYNVPVVSPITKTVKLSNNTFQSRPAEGLLKNKILNYFKARDSLTNTILIFDSKSELKSGDLKSAFVGASVVRSRKDKNGKEGFYIQVSDISKYLKPGKNVVFLETEIAGYASNVTGILNSLNTENIQIVLATTEMNDAFESSEVSNQHLSNLHFHYASISKSFDDDLDNGFVKTYTEIYGLTPNKIAVRGFDVTMDVVLRLMTSTNLYDSVSDAPLTEYVENKFAYKKTPFGGYYNDAVYLLKYDDLKIVEVKD
ncbi:LysM peptidoglycan-binding domain-containing protein [Formosa sp. PL04]|uniref:PBP1 and LysM peptidoglycan-binding domain-containing protein n=1 Tax=Formosa sp. PL04 TaxID=3081755 RepID=UPI0029813493|nr:LysM peptidoglycan-binding domain-containing protein [Formosa sp. PL04]MDW5290077.1 LysM peptidoglycan-binding domain-containing protein [Formosa sp. PL04]